MCLLLRRQIVCSVRLALSLGVFFLLAFTLNPNLPILSSTEITPPPGYPSFTVYGVSILSAGLGTEPINRIFNSVVLWDQLQDSSEVSCDPTSVAYEQWSQPNGLCVPCGQTVNFTETLCFAVPSTQVFTLAMISIGLVLALLTSFLQFYGILHKVKDCRFEFSRVGHFADCFERLVLFPGA